MSKIYKRKCDNCGKSYEGSGKKFCSPECYRSTNLIKKFWSRVDIYDLFQCWTWTAATRGSSHYGGMRWEGRVEGAHRIAYQLAIGPIPKNLSVLHICDNPKCCNPAHLFLGTQNDNVQDMILKGRKARGELCGRTNLKAEDVRQIRTLVKSGITQTAVGKIFGVRPNTISCIVNRNRWAHIK